MEDLNREFNDCVRNIMYLCIKINDSFERTRTMQWVRKLSQHDQSFRLARIRNEYIHFLNIMLANKPIYFSMPFNRDPPEEGNLTPLTELLANTLLDECPQLPRSGPIKPVLCHKSEDGRAFMTVKRCPEGGVFCYMAVAPHVLGREGNK